MERILSIANDKYITEIDYDDININEIVVRVMAVIGKIKGMTGEQRKELAIEVVTYILDKPELKISDTVRQLMKASLTTLIDVIYQQHKGKLFSVAAEWNQDIKEIDTHLINYFKFPVDKELDYNDIYRVVSYVVKLIDSYKKWKKHQKKYVSLQVIIEFLKRFIIQDNVFSRQLINNLIDLAIQVSDGKFTITGKQISKVKQFFKAFKCTC